MHLADLPTPAAAVDLDRVERNGRWMKDRAARLGVRLRPHVKTHKCPELARLQTDGDAVTVSTLAEARAFAAHFADVLYAVPLAPERAGEAASIPGLTVLVDSERAIEALRQPAMLKIDCGYHRAGVPPALALPLARRLAQRGLFAGLLTHAGHSYAAADLDEVRRIASTERDLMVALAAELRAAGIAVPCVSVGSTPTMRHVDHLAGVDEIRPGNYVFFDGCQTALESCTRDQEALCVVTSVVGHYPWRRAAVVDAGALALSKDRGATHRGATGFGRVTRLDGEALPAQLVGLSQEHGKLHGDVSGISVGQKLLIWPQHSCLTAGAHGQLHAHRRGELRASWATVRGW